MGRRYPRWLDTAVFYEIYPQSFYDTNGDGIGDIPGITQKLDYIRELGCNALWLNPCFASPFGDAGYDVRLLQRGAPLRHQRGPGRPCSGGPRAGMRVPLTRCPAIPPGSIPGSGNP